ncbi:MAG: hypothetical protein Q4B96_05075 [Bacillota bacterium]|nr:hypothetical protein [Bacillota bacterium]
MGKKKTAATADTTLGYIQAHLKIQDKNGRLIPLIFNQPQLTLYREIERQQAAGKPVRIIILKARQIGFSTAVAALFFQRTATIPHTNSMIVAHKADASANIFNKTKLFYEELPEALRPLKKASNARELLFENPSSKAAEKAQTPGLRSKIEIETAGNSSAGRSATVHNLHLSELAYWPHPEATLISLMQAVPYAPHTMVIIESTACGVGGEFYRQWLRAQRGESEFVPLFFPWWSHDEYRLDGPEPLTATPEEQELSQLYALDEQQLRWRRHCISANCGGDESVFAQEYPACAEEAFLASGRPVFDVRALARALAAAPEPLSIGRLELDRDGRPLLLPAERGYMRVWQPPQAGCDYIIGVDSAGGSYGGDFSAMAVLERGSRRIVAEWHGHIDPDLLGGEAVMLARWYNGALLVPEANNHGVAVINAIKRAHYPRLYRRRSIDRVTDVLTQEYGFWTSGRSKRLLISTLAAYIREDALRLPSRELIGECLSYVYDERGQTNAQSGCYDDRVIAAALAVYAAGEHGEAAPFIALPLAELYDIDDRTGY